MASVDTHNADPEVARWANARIIASRTPMQMMQKRELARFGLEIGKAE
jgi:hypothetical protein